MTTIDPKAVPADPDLLAEREALHEARAALRRMREEVDATELLFGDAAKDKVTDAALRRGRERRLAALADIPGAPLYFGRLDFDPGTVFLDEGPDSADGGQAPTASTADEPDRVNIGRRHVHDGRGKPVVLDWRAPISVAYYQASPSDRMKVRVRRRYGFGTVTGPGGEPESVLTAFEDEDLMIGEDAPEASLGSELLNAEIERPRTGPMRDIVATIQPEQDALVRAPLETTLCVQGAPGTGKTAVGLHRVAFLLYSERERLSRSGVAIIGPNRSFLSYIQDVLPALEVRPDAVVVDPPRAGTTVEGVPIAAGVEALAGAGAEVILAVRNLEKGTVATESIRITRLDPLLPLASITRITKFLSDNGVITRDISGEIADHYTYEFLSRATGKSPAELGLNQ